MKNIISILFVTMVELLPKQLQAETPRDRLEKVTITAEETLFPIVQYPPYAIKTDRGEEVVIAKCQYDKTVRSDPQVLTINPNIKVAGHLTIVQQLTGDHPLPKQSDLYFILKPFDDSNMNMSHTKLDARRQQYIFYGIVNSGNLTAEPIVYGLLDDYWLDQLTKANPNRQKMDSMLATVHSDSDAVAKILGEKNNVYLSLSLFRECLISGKIATPESAFMVIDAFKNDRKASIVFFASALRYGNREIERAVFESLIAKLKLNLSEEQIFDIQQIFRCAPSTSTNNQALLDQFNELRVAMLTRRGYFNP